MTSISIAMLNYKDTGLVILNYPAVWAGWLQFWPAVGFQLVFGGLSAIAIGAVYSLYGLLTSEYSFCGLNFLSTLFSDFCTVFEGHLADGAWSRTVVSRQDCDRVSSSVFAQDLIIVGDVGGGYPSWLSHSAVISDKPVNDSTMIVRSAGR